MFKYSSKQFKFKYFKNYLITSYFKTFSRSIYYKSMSIRHFAEENTPDENLFISENSNSEFFPIQKKILDDLISESEEYSEYNNMLTILRDYSNSQEFSLDKFKQVVNYILEHQIVDSVMSKLFESVLLKNLNLIDYETKSVSVLVLGEHIEKKKLAFQEDNWLFILKDFHSLVDNMNFQDYYNYIITFDKIFVKRSPGELNKNFREFDNFVSQGNQMIFNSGSIKINKTSDLILFSKLTHNGILKIGGISDVIWSRIGRVIYTNAHEMNIYEILVVTSLLINLNEVTGKANFLLTEAIKEVNKTLHFMLKNFELLELDDQIKLVNHADNLFNYYILFIYNNGGENYNIFNAFTKSNIEKQSNMNINTPQLPEDSFLNTIIRIYTSQIKNKEDLVIYKEFRVLHFLSKEVKYKEAEFWNLLANRVLECMTNDFLKIKNDIMPKKLLSSSSMSNDEKLRYLEKCNMQLLVYVGMIIESFGNVDYSAPEFWEPFLQKVDEFVNFKNKDIFTILNFISLGCRKIYRREIFEDVWNKLIDMMDPKLKHILKHKEIIEFVIKVNSYGYSSKTDVINLEELNLCLNKLFFAQNDQKEITPIKLFSTFFGLMESKIKDDEKVINYILIKLDNENFFECSCRFD